MNADAIKQTMAASGKMKVSQLMAYMKARHAGEYNLEFASFKVQFGICIF